MFDTFVVEPIYNVFIYLIGIMPYGDVGLAIFALTLIIRIIFYPAFASSIRTQLGMQAIQGEVDVINKEYKDNPTERAKRTMALFKKHNIRPFSSFLALLIQLPIFFALYWAFFREQLPNVATNMLYSFVPPPDVINMHFLGVLDLNQSHNILLTLLVAGLQYAVMWFSVARLKNAPKSSSPEKDAALRTQQQLMLYFFPAMMGVLTYSFPAAVGLYFAATNVISIGQELIIRKQLTAARI